MFKNFGLIALIIKISPAVLKLIKSAKFIKVSLAGGSMMAYSYLFTWEFALILLLAIVFHEYGHITGMKKCGMKTKGIYLIPFFGGAAVPEEGFKNRRDETYTALYGPWYGLLLTIPFLIYGVIFESPLAIGLVSFMALINLFNLFPINPLDGGRVLKSFAFSMNNTLGMFVVFSGLLFATGLVYYFHIWLLLIIIVIGSLELFFEWIAFKNPEKQLIEFEEFKIKLVEEDAIFNTIIQNDFSDLDIELQNKYIQIYNLYLKKETKHITEEENNILNEENNISIDDYLKYIEEKYNEYRIEQLTYIKKEHKQKNMNKRQIKKYGLYYILLVITFIGLIFYTSQYEGADLALKFLKDDME